MYPDLQEFRVTYNALQAEFRRGHHARYYYTISRLQDLLKELMA